MPHLRGVVVVLLVVSLGCSGVRDAASGAAVSDSEPHDDMTSVSACIESLKSQNGDALFGTEGVAEVCRCVVPMVAAKYSLADQRRLNEIPKTHGLLGTYKDEYMSYAMFISGSASDCGRELTVPGSLAREAREAANWEARRVADSVAEEVADEAARANAPPPEERIMRQTLEAIAREQSSFYTRVGFKRCFGGQGPNSPNCSVYFSSLAELREGWQSMNSDGRAWPGDEWFQPPGVDLDFTVGPSEWQVTATHDSTAIACVAAQRSGVAGVQFRCQ